MFLSDSDQAIIFVTSADGESIMANLTSLAALRADGTIKTDGDLQRLAPTAIKRDVDLAQYQKTDITNFRARSRA
jgi:hypothetical protein